MPLTQKALRSAATSTDKALLSFLQKLGTIAQCCACFSVSQKLRRSKTCNVIFFCQKTVFPVIYFANLPKWFKEKERNRVEFGMEAVR